MVNKLKRSNFRWLIVFLLFFILIFNFIDRSATSFILEQIHDEFGFSDTQLGIIMGSFSIGFIVTAFLGSICLDKFGPKIIFAIMVFIWMISMISMALASGFMLFFMARVLLGLAEGPTFPSLTMATSKWLPVKERSASLSFIFVASTIGIVLSGPLVTFLVYSFSWRIMFIILAGVSLMWLPIWLYFFKNKPEDSKYVNKLELDYIKDTDVYIKGTRQDLYSKKQILLNNLINITIISNLLAYSIFCFFFYFFVSWLPSYYSRTYEIGILEQGGIIIIIWSIASIFMFCSGPFFDFIYKRTDKLRYARSYPILMSSLVSAVSIIILLIGDLNINTSVILITLSVSFLMLSAPIYYAVNLDIVKYGTGFALGVMEASSSLAGFFAPVITGYIIEITKNFYSIFLFLVVLAIINCVNIYLFHNPDKYKL